VKALALTTVGCILFVSASSAQSQKAFQPMEIQRALANAGYYSAPVDGLLGPKTRAAVKAFQEANGLKADGVCGDKTWQKLKVFLGDLVAPHEAHTVSPSTKVSGDLLGTPDRKLSRDELKQKLIP
jgi:peptidoglycan hydrolase-like protein with peptidoglycan-binding domain